MSMVEDLSGRIIETVRRYWGHEDLRPLQEEAILSGLERRDSLVVLPTGGGKSLCYQVPPVLEERTDVVVSPLISLMKDQVDGLQANGYPAAAVHSNLTAGERRAILDEALDGQYRLLFVSPERLANPGFLDFLDRLNVGAFAIDEAHCISHWGHDFRPEYRRLAELKDRFPGAAMHAFTATATERVRQDIVEQLSLRDPRILVGTFDRENLVYRVLPKVEVRSQVIEILSRHEQEPAIVYCLSRRDTEQLASSLKQSGIKAAPYHAGMNRQERTRTQDEFAKEKLDVVVATVAFGMGIDRSNVRCVIHAAVPKSIEHYQQETGRAGRDGLDADCVLLYSFADAIRWEHLMRMSAGEAEGQGDGESLLGPQNELLQQMMSYCGTLECRHRALSRYFGQAYTKENCGACDVCLGEVEPMEDSTVVAQKILSCVARTGQTFGVGHVVAVLRGADTEAVRRRGHDDLSTFGLLKEVSEKALTNLIYQLVGQALLDRTPGDRPILKLNAASVCVLKSEREVRLLTPSEGRVRRAPLLEASWEGVDRGLFDHLRDLRRELASERGVPAYVIFGDETLRSLARMRPSSLPGMSQVRGIGEKKLADLGPTFLAAMDDHCGMHELPRDA